MAITNTASDIKKVVHYALQRAGEKQLTQVASSLTFTTVLGIVPLLAVVLSLFTAFPLFAEFRVALENFLSGSLMPPAVSENIMEYLNLFASKASGLTAIGSLALIVTSVMLIMTIDEAFNNIWQVTKQRPLSRRILVYWAIISLGPILAGGSLWATSILANESLNRVGELPASLNIALSIVPLIVTGLGFTALFIGVPNRNVAWKDALIGGLGTAIVLEAMRLGFAYYLVRFPSYTIIYGAFATLPIFLLWIYMSWLAILLGATVAATLPDIRQRRWALHHYAGASFVDAVLVLEALWRTQALAMPGLSLANLEGQLQMHQDDLRDVLKTLKQLGYVVDTQDEKSDMWVLACDQREATLDALVDAMIIDRKQPGLQEQPLLLRALASSLKYPGMPLKSLFETPGTLVDKPPALPESAQIGQNS
ncbi:YihY family inner membrane protein [Alcaligenaceae bacterium]|nr:YihY family inner membrane protein [Alcaligenaceae bacterium]